MRSRTMSASAWTGSQGLSVRSILMSARANRANIDLRVQTRSTTVPWSQVCTTAAVSKASQGTTVGLMLMSAPPGPARTALLAMSRVGIIPRSVRRWVVLVPAGMSAMVLSATTTAMRRWNVPLESIVWRRCNWVAIVSLGWWTVKACACRSVSACECTHRACRENGELPLKNDDFFELKTHDCGFVLQLHWRAA